MALNSSVPDALPLRRAEYVLHSTYTTYRIKLRFLYLSSKQSFIAYCICFILMVTE